MYIALKWLIGLSLAMWLSICYIDICLTKDIKLISIASGHFKNDTQGSSTIKRYQQYSESYEPKGFVLLNYAMFLAGAIVVILYNLKHEILLYIKAKIKETKPHIDIVKEYIKEIDLKKTVKIVWHAMHKQILSLWGIINSYTSTIKEFRKLAKTRNTESKYDHINILFVLKLCENEKQRKKMAQLLLIAVQENKNLRKRFQLELITKNRLLKHIADTQNTTKETKEKVGFLQNLYLTANRDAVFYKSRIELMTKEKEKADKTIIELVKRIYQTTNPDLIEYCTQVIVSTKKNLSPDVSKEINTLITNYQTRKITLAPNFEQPQQAILDQTDVKILEKCECAEMTILTAGDKKAETCDYNGVPGERLLAVKDKDGLIEKIYEYNYESDYDNGDTIRRIREYSVYCDKDCYLDYKNSRTIINQRTNYTTTMRNHGVLGSNKFLTGSKLFQQFLLDNKEIIPVQPQTRKTNIIKFYGIRNDCRL